MEQPIRVLIVDDSSFTRHILAKHLDADPAITVVGQARDGEDALEQIARLRPDVITLDVEMPRMDGMTTLQRIMTDFPTPVVMLSAWTQSSTRTTIRALLWGAVDFVGKPSSTVDIQSVVAELIPKIRIAAGVRAERLDSTEPPAMGAPAVQKRALQPLRRDDPIVVIGASAGGPRALRRVLADFPFDFPGALLVVQHMSAQFTAAMAARLNELSALTVQEATSGQALARGLALVAPGEFHLRVGAYGQVLLDSGQKVNGVRPAVDVTMESAAEVYGPFVVGVVLTGMGADGLAGARQIKAAGGRMIAEDESSCLIYGMPRGVVEAGLADRVVPLSGVVPAILELVR